MAPPSAITPSPSCRSWGILWAPVSGLAMSELLIDGKVPNTDKEGCLLTSVHMDTMCMLTSIWTWTWWICTSMHMHIDSYVGKRTPSALVGSHPASSEQQRRDQSGDSDDDSSAPAALASAAAAAVAPLASSAEECLWSKAVDAAVVEWPL